MTTIFNLFYKGAGKEENDNEKMKEEIDKNRRNQLENQKLDGVAVVRGQR